VAPVDPNDAKETDKNVDTKVAKEVAELLLLRKQNVAQCAAIEQLKTKVLEMQQRSAGKSSAAPSLPKKRKVDAGGEGSSAGGSRAPTKTTETSKQKAYFDKVKRR